MTDLKLPTKEKLLGAANATWEQVKVDAFTAMTVAQFGWGMVKSFVNTQRERVTRPKRDDENPEKIAEE